MLKSLAHPIVLFTAKGKGSKLMSGRKSTLIFWTTAASYPSMTNRALGIRLAFIALLLILHRRWRVPHKCVIKLC